ncbi:FUSC family protein [Sphingomonas fuzhouensis]|uniref:FUSC family protein n=1 Tax=Sphingomonas fuzhouensis TaxID=3106033 RepID=UPI002AFDD28C|nr:FUSC family protein [Sphingomonas sp. SGZ-02]
METRDTLRQIFRFDWRGAVVAMPALFLLLLAGVLSHAHVAASIAAGAAFAVGFGATKRVRHRNLDAMLLTGGGMAVVSILGTLVGRDPYLELVVTMLMGGLCGALIRWDTTLWWVWLQVIIAFLLAANYPGDLSAGLHRAALVTLGTGVQIAMVWLMKLAIDTPASVSPPDEDVRARDMVLHALRAAICIGVALLASRAVHLIHQYWAPMTAMIVLKPGLRDTALRGVERIGGTILGIVIATAIILATGSPILRVIAVTLFGAAAFGLQQARYAVLATAITASVVLMIALAGSEVLGVDWDRLTATLIGGLVALAGAALAPKRRVPESREGIQG